MNAPCIEIQTLLSRLLDGDLAPHERQAAEAHLTGCPGCREALAAERRVGDLLAVLPEIPCPPALEARILAAADESRVDVLLASLPELPCPPALEQRILAAVVEDRPGALLASLPELPCPPALEERIRAAVEEGRRKVERISTRSEARPLAGYRPGTELDEVAELGRASMAGGAAHRPVERGGIRRRSGWPAAAALALALAAVLLVFFLPRAPVPQGPPTAYSRAEVVAARRQARAELTRAARLIRQAEEEAVRQALVVELQSRLRDCLRQKALRI